MKTKLFFLFFFYTFFSFYADAQSGEKLGNRKKEQTKPNLYILSIGVPSDDLVYTKKDAEAIFNSFKSQEGYLFGKVEGEILVCKDVTTSSSIKEKIELLKDSYQITADDILLVFLSGHGQVTSAFGEIDFGFASSEKLLLEKNKLISYKQHILSPIKELPCKCLIFIDACQTGSITGQKANENEQIQKQLSEIQKQIINTPASIITFSSSSNNESSWEDNQWNHGAFTKAIIDGFGGVADKNRDSFISLQELADYVISTVPELVKPIKKVNQQPRIVGKIDNKIDGDYVIFNYINKLNNYQQRIGNCENPPPPPIPAKQIAVIGLKPNTTNKYDTFLSNITKSHLEEGEKGERKFSSITQSIKLAESGIADKLCNGGKVFIPAEYNPIDYFLVLKREPTSYEQNNSNQIWTASITLSYCFINTLSKEIEKSGQETITGADSLKSEAEKRAIERVLQVLNLKSEINETN